MLKLLPFIFVVGCLFLLFANPYWLRIASSALLLSSLSYAHNLLFYFLGYPAFGGVAFFGLGAYTFSFLYSKGFPLIPSLLLSMLIPSLFALILLPIMLRLKSHYFAISTLALQVMLMELVENIEFLGGTKGYALNLSHHANIIAEKVIEVVEIKKAFGGNKVLEGVSFSAEAGKVVGIIGQSYC
jgi:branched-chain amino acid transport system permease protein